MGLAATSGCACHIPITSGSMNGFSPYIFLAEWDRVFLNFFSCCGAHIVHPRKSRRQRFPFPTSWFWFDVNESCRYLLCAWCCSTIYCWYWNMSLLLLAKTKWAEDWKWQFSKCWFKGPPQCIKHYQAQDLVSKCHYIIFTTHACDLWEAGTIHHSLIEGEKERARFWFRQKQKPWLAFPMHLL